MSKCVYADICRRYSEKDRKCIGKPKKREDCVQSFYRSQQIRLLQSVVELYATGFYIEEENDNFK